jgi:hypothetical protein
MENQIADNLRCDGSHQNSIAIVSYASEDFLICTEKSNYGSFLIFGSGAIAYPEVNYLCLLE